MRIRHEGLVQLISGEALLGVVSRLGWWWRHIRVYNATGVARNGKKGEPTPGYVFIPKTSVLFIQIAPPEATMNVRVEQAERATEE